MKEKKRTFLVAFSVALLFSVLYLWYPGFLQRFDDSLRDQFFLLRGEIEASEDIVIVDIDEASLRALGQWPWPRNIMAKIVEHLTSAGAAAIGFDILFAEEDRTSPRRVAKILGLTNSEEEKIPDYDRIFADALMKAPAVLGFVFNFESDVNSSAPPLSAIYIEKGKEANGAGGIPEARGISANLPLFQESVCCSGSFNMIPDSDGIVRYVPLLIRYEGSLYPSLSFELFRALSGVGRVVVRYDGMGVSSIDVGRTQIPVDAFGRLFVNYRGGRGRYRYLSAADFYFGRFDPQSVAGKVVLIGTSAPGLLDMRATPFESTIPGVEIHANVIDNLINGDFLQRPAFAPFLNVGLILFCAILAWAMLVFLSPFVALGALLGASVGLVFALYQMLFSGGYVLAGIYPLLTLLGSSLPLFVYRLFKEAKQKTLIKNRFAKKVSAQVAELLIETPELDLGPKEREVTIFFSDIRGFTTISERLGSATELIAFLNRYMSPMSEIIIEHRGTIDKYIGDAIMAYWNAPVETPDHADLAVASALRQIEALEDLNRQFQKEGKMPISIGVGIHTDIATVGEMGSEGRSDFTIIGDSVNLCSRIEGLTKIYDAKIIISEHTKARLRHPYKIIELDRVAVKGKQIPVTIYEVVGFGVFDEEEKAMMDDYAKALELYRGGYFEEARIAFESLFSRSGKTLFGLYCERCEKAKKKKIEQFDGVYRYDTK